MKRRKKYFKYKDALVILVWFLAFTLYFAYLLSGFGLVIAGKSASVCRESIMSLEDAPM